MISFEKTYIFRVHTNKYAGNFERMMGAYITGYGDGTHGQDLANWVEVNEEEVFEAFDPFVALRRDDDGHERFASIVQSPYYMTDGMGNVYLQENLDSSEILKNYKNSVAEEAKERESKGQKPHSYPDTPKMWAPYYSVGIFLLKPPPEDVLELATERASLFVEKLNADEFNDIEPMAKYVTRDIQIHGCDMVVVDPTKISVWDSDGT